MTDTPANPRILIVDDHPDMADGLAEYLSGHAYDAESAVDGKSALERLGQADFDVVITDLRMPAMDGFELLTAIRALDETLPVFVMTAFGSIDGAIEAVRRGAFHYLTKPIETEELLVYVQRAVEHRNLKRSHSALLSQSRDLYTYESMIGRSASMQRIFETIDRIADSPASVLILGESGTGKELIARALHFGGRRRGSPFVAVNCAAIPATLLEAELFGYEKGAFTGAAKARRGLVAESHGGTLFLDEIGDLPLELQPKLLRLLQEGEVRPVGSDVSRKVDVRVVAATHASLKERIQEGTFRSDLFYRLNVVPIEVPPLRQRLEDLPPLADRLLARMRERNESISATGISPKALEVLTHYDWPGNVRELENVLERAATMARGETLSDEDFDFLEVSQTPQQLAPADEDYPSLREMERRYIQRVLEHVGGNRTRAAAILGVDPSTLYRKSKRGDSKS